MDDTLAILHNNMLFLLFNDAQSQKTHEISRLALRHIADISEAVGRISVQTDGALDLRLRRLNRIRTIQGSLAIEGNPLSEKQIAAILDGKHVISPPREIQEARNAIPPHYLDVPAYLDTNMDR